MQEPGSMAPVAQILTSGRRTNSRQHTPCTLVRLIRTHDDREPTAVTMDRTASNVCATNMDVICSPTALARKSSGGLALDSLLTRRSQSQACVVEGADSEYTSTYGVNAQGNQLSSSIPCTLWPCTLWPRGKMAVQATTAMQGPSMARAIATSSALTT